MRKGLPCFVESHLQESLLMDAMDDLQTAFQYAHSDKSDWLNAALESLIQYPLSNLLSGKRAIDDSAHYVATATSLLKICIEKQYSQMMLQAAIECLGIALELTQSKIRLSKATC